MITRRNLIVSGVAAWMAAPAIVRASSLMLLKGVPYALYSDDEALARYRDDMLASEEDVFAYAAKEIDGMTIYTPPPPASLMRRLFLPLPGGI